jgi:pimeloyl-ACP methyl ester carboxylesterase
MVRLSPFYVRAPGDAGDRVLLVMLPGAQIRPQDFAERGFVAALHARHRGVDVAAVDADLGAYLDGDLAERLHEDVLGPAATAGYARIWLMGVSLGATGALLYARAHPGRVDGIILIAPFLGTRGLVAEAMAAGGLAAWKPGAIAAGDRERALLAWLKSSPLGRAARPSLHLAYGSGDRFADASLLLAGRMPTRRVIVGEGGHDWPTWTALWHALLDRAPFGESEMAEGLTA